MRDFRKLLAIFVGIRTNDERKQLDTLGVQLRIMIVLICSIVGPIIRVSKHDFF